MYQDARGSGARLALADRQVGEVTVHAVCGGRDPLTATGMVALPSRLEREREVLSASRTRDIRTANIAVFLDTGRRARSDPARGSMIRRFSLTPREAEVALLLGARLTTREIAAELGISPHTVRRHVEHILPKLELSSREGVRFRIAEVTSRDKP